MTEDWKGRGDMALPADVQRGGEGIRLEMGDISTHADAPSSSERRQRRATRPRSKHTTT
jgi:hypothetical protein